MLDLQRNPLAQYRDRTYQQHLDRPLGTCLGRGCCRECGASPCVCGTVEDTRIVVCDGVVVSD